MPEINQNSIQWQIGDIIENRWEIKEKLEGGRGIAYIGYDRGSIEFIKFDWQNLVDLTARLF